MRPVSSTTLDLKIVLATGARGVVRCLYELRRRGRSGVARSTAETFFEKVLDIATDPVLESPNHEEHD
jgi:hypothetical protein